MNRIVIVLATCLVALLATASWLNSRDVAADTTKVEGSPAGGPADDAHRRRSYPLPVGAARSLEGLAARSDVLIFGEVHGTQEVPAVVEAMLTPLTKLGYGVLAVEIPADQREHLVAWAAGEAATAPGFFSRPNPDGRGNIQMLALIRTALSAPFRWQLICFDETEAAMQSAEEELKAMLGSGEIPPSALLLPPGTRLPDAFIALDVRRDATMAANLADQLHPPAPHAKVLAICGDLHARTANHPPPDDPTGPLWPSFAAVLQGRHAAWHVNSVKIQSHTGGFFNGGKVNVIHAKPLDEAEVRPTHDGEWNMELHLPRATPATFLAPPSEIPAPPPGHGI